MSLVPEWARASHCVRTSADHRFQMFTMLIDSTHMHYIFEIIHTSLRTIASRQWNFGMFQVVDAALLSLHQEQSLRRAFGSWPPPGFESLTGDQVTQFWKSLKDKHGDDLKLVAKEFLTRVTETGEAWNEGGTFQPLGYYATLGYDIEKIKKLTDPKDQRPHPVLGMTYRVRLMTTNTFGKRADIHGESFNGGREEGSGNFSVPRRRAKRVRAICDGNTGAAGSGGAMAGNGVAGAAAAAAAGTGAESEDEAKESDHNSDSSSSSSSTSSSDKNLN